MESLIPEQPSPGGLYSNFWDAALSAGKDIKEHTQLMQDEQSRAILEDARKSRANNAEEITGWKVTDHADWLASRKENDKELGQTEIDDEIVNAAPDPDSMGAMRKAMQSFQETHTGIDLDFDEPNKTLTVVLIKAYT